MCLSLHNLSGTCWVSRLISETSFDLDYMMSPRFTMMYCLENEAGRWLNVRLARIKFLLSDITEQHTNTCSVCLCSANVNTCLQQVRYWETRKIENPLCYGTKCNIAIWITLLKMFLSSFESVLWCILRLHIVMLLNWSVLHWKMYLASHSYIDGKTNITGFLQCMNIEPYH